jgi:Tfp pilus assembly protein PilX
MAFIRENFHHLSQTGILTGLTTEEMIKLLQDDYLQAHELDVLRAALRWAENAAREKEPDIIKKRKKEPSNDLIRNALGKCIYQYSNLLYSKLRCSHTSAWNTSFPQTAPIWRKCSKAASS